MKKSIILKLIICAVLVSVFIPGLAQNNLQSEFYQNSMSTNNTGMYVLGGWAIANIVSGGIGWHNNSGSSKYFHQMNLFWNTVNLSIAGFALYNNLAGETEFLTNELMIKNHVKTEKLYLINGGLDLLYIGTAFYLKNLSLKKENKKDLLKGYGNSIILQGSFLLFFDAVMWIIQRNHRLQFLENMRFSVNQFNQITEFSLAVSF